MTASQSNLARAGLPAASIRVSQPNNYGKEIGARLIFLTKDKGAAPENEKETNLYRALIV